MYKYRLKNPQEMRIYRKTSCPSGIYAINTGQFNVRNLLI